MSVRMWSKWDSHTMLTNVNWDNYFGKEFDNHYQVKLKICIILTQQFHFQVSEEVWHMSTRWFIQGCLCCSMLIVAQNWNHPKDSWWEHINTLCCSHTIEYYRTVKINELDLHIPILINLKIKVKAICRKLCAVCHWYKLYEHAKQYCISFMGVWIWSSSNIKYSCD